MNRNIITVSLFIFSFASLSLHSCNSKTEKAEEKTEAKTDTAKKAAPPKYALETIKKFDAFNGYMVNMCYASFGDPGKACMNKGICGASAMLPGQPPTCYAPAIIMYKDGGAQKTIIIIANLNDFVPDANTLPGNMDPVGTAGNAVIDKNLFNTATDMNIPAATVIKYTFNSPFATWQVTF